MDAADGQDAAQDADRLPTLPRQHPQPATCQHAHVAVTGEPVAGTTGTAGSDRGSLEKGLPNRYLASDLPVRWSRCACRRPVSAVGWGRAGRRRQGEGDFRTKVDAVACRVEVVSPGEMGGRDEAIRCVAMSMWLKLVKAYPSFLAAVQVRPDLLDRLVVRR